MPSFVDVVCIAILAGVSAGAVVYWTPIGVRKGVAWVRVLMRGYGYDEHSERPPDPHL